MKRLFFALVRVLCACLCIVPGFWAASCHPEPGEDDPGTVPPQAWRTARVYALCEGLYGMNNTSLFFWNVSTGQTSKTLFKDVNGRAMGDTGNDLEIYGGKMYAVMNGSNLLEVMDAATALSLKQVPMVDGNGVGRQPRYLCAYEGKVYVASFDNTVCRIDTGSLEVEAVVEVGRNPDGICVSKGKLYVSNSGGLDYPDYDRTVSVVDVASFTEIKRIEVGGNPYAMGSDRRGYVYVSTRGDYEGYGRKSACGPGSDREREDGFPKKEGYGFYRIDPEKDEVDRNFGLPVLNFCIAGDTAYLYRYDYNDRTSSVMVFDLLSEKVLTEDFVGESVDLQTPYAIAVDPYQGYVFVGEAYNFMRSGSVYCFDKAGRLLHSFPSVGLNPSSFAFYPEQESR